jgi:hypothetical protein
MKKNVEAIFFIPFCEKDYEMLIDVIHSIQFYVKEPHHIIAVDDFSPSRWNDKLKQEFPGVTALRNPRSHGGRSGLYVTQALACKHALEHFDFRIFIKMDTDALMVGPFLVTRAIQKFEAEPDLGILGSYRQRADGKRRQWLRWKVMFLWESSQFRRFYKKPVLWKDAIKEARKSGYDLGENILGGCYIINEKTLKVMNLKGYLDYEYDHVINHSQIGDEIIYSLFCKASGFNIEDFGRPEDPMVIALDMVPLPKEKIVSKNKSVIHSVKMGFNKETQQDLRKFFKSFRNGNT